MNKLKRILPGLLVILLLAGCNAPAVETEPTVIRPAEIQPTDTQPVETQPQNVGPVFPEEDVATGLLKFYFGDQQIHAGGMVSEVLALEPRTFADLSQMLLPGHVSDILRMDIPDENGEETCFFIRAINTGDTAAAIADCRIYAVIVNTEGNASFGSGMEEEPFRNMKTTEEEILAAYGEPDFSRSGDEQYREIAYYSPFDHAYFAFEKGVLRQIVTCWSADYHGAAAEAFGEKLPDFFGNDAWILLDRFLDTKPYREGNVKKNTGVLDEIPMDITVDSQQIRLGCFVHEMPEKFSDPYREVPTHLGGMRYLRIGIGNPEEFYVINRHGLRDSYVYYAEVKGIFTSNRGYTNWGRDFSDYHEFAYAEISSDSTIADVLAAFGEPEEIYCSSNANYCFTWLHYRDAAGNEFRICVDPMVDQIVELSINKYYEGQLAY